MSHENFMEEFLSKLTKEMNPDKTGKLIKRLHDTGKMPEIVGISMQFMLETNPNRQKELAEKLFEMVGDLDEFNE